MTDIWFLSDTHFGQKNILNFKRDDGTPLRPFLTLHEMNECIYDNWNQTVKPQDKIYHLGDLAFGLDGQIAMSKLKLLPGKKRLILGNHDEYTIKEYLAVFQKVQGVRRLEDMWLSHCPMHWCSVKDRKVTANIHGHMHAKQVGEPKYFNVSVERINYTPIHLDEIRAKVKEGGLW